jgi:hypothetical protein
MGRIRSQEQGSVIMPPSLPRAVVDWKAPFPLNHFASETKVGKVPRQQQRAQKQTLSCLSATTLPTSHTPGIVAELETQPAKKNCVKV